MASVAEVIVQTLVKAGVKRVYGVVGDSLNSIVDAVRRTDGIEWIHVRNEEAGAFAAGAEAQLSGNLAVCAGSCGPGHVHLINGLFDCHRTRASVLAIAAHIPSAEIGTGYFQETHPDRLFQECSHYCETVLTPKQIPRVLQIAIQTAVSKGGVSVLVVPGDVGTEDVPDIAPFAHPVFESRPRIRPTDSDLQRLAQLLTSHNKITLLCGRGCAGAHAEVMRLAATLKAPVVHSLAGKEFIERDNPHDVGMTGLIGIPSGARAVQDCELLLMLGTDFPYTDWYPKKAKIAQIDLRPEQLGRRTHVDLGLVGDIKETLEALLPLLPPDITDGEFLKSSLEDHRKSADSLNSHAHGKAGQKPIHPEYVTCILNELASDDAIFTVDTGMVTVWAARYLRMTAGRRMIGSWVHGSMANALPQAIGAQLLYPKRQVISLSGDGGFSMLMGDFLTILKHDLPFKTLIYNNGTLGMVKLEMEVAGLPDYGVDFKGNVNYARIAEAVGVRGIRVEDPADVRSGIEAWLSHDGPALLDVVTNPYELSIPPSIKIAQAVGYGLFMLKEVFGGHFTEPVELVESNLR
jgi:pyruvate dehydrogenase (quinone)